MNIHFYADRRGHQPVYDWIQEMKRRKPETFRRTYYLLDMLKTNGKLIQTGKVASKDVKKLKGTDIWQLRIHDDRVLFFYYEGDTIVLTNQFEKKQNETPANEIQHAEKCKEDWIQRNK
jgi:phage-related protein